MKKLLIASTALVATAGMAAAEITFGGYGRFGIVYNEGATAETAIEQRFRMTVTGIAESDNGVKFEGRIRFEANDEGASKAAGKGPGAAGFAVTSGGFRMDVGHVSDALDSGDTLNYYGYGVGLTAIVEMNNNFDTGFVAGGFGAGKDTDVIAQKVKFRYTAGDFVVNASYAPQTNLGNGETFQLGAGYNFGDHSVGFVYGDEDGGEDFWVIGADGSFGDFSYAAVIGEAGAGDTSWGLSGNYAVSAATSIQGVVAGGGAAGNDETYGVGVAHSLGGGVTLKGGIASDKGGNTKADAGVIFSF